MNGSLACFELALEMRPGNVVIIGPAWADGLMEDCRKGLSRLFPFTKAEREFLDRVLDHGEIRAELLTDDEALGGRIAQHPSLAWKVQNVKKHFGR
jgi:hypothetical protein